MHVKETIAFIGEADKIYSQLIQKLAAKNYPLVLVAKEDNHFDDLFGEIVNQTPEADIEIINCEREGCWEADVIVFNNLKDFDPKLPEKIKEVVNQKILVYLLNKENQSISTERVNNFQQLLPNTEWVQVIFDPVSEEVHITDVDEAAVIVEDIFNRAGYTTILLKTIE